MTNRERYYHTFCKWFYYITHGLDNTCIEYKTWNKVMSIAGRLKPRKIKDKFKNRPAKCDSDDLPF